MEKTIHINNVILTQMDARYYFPYLRLSNNRESLNTIADSLLPTFIAKKIKEENPFAVINRNYIVQTPCLSERTAKLMGSQLIPTQDIITMLGHTKTEIGKLLQTVKNKSLKIHVIGAGGTGSNFIWWLTKLCQLTGKKHIFENFNVYDDDAFDVINMIRIPFIPSEATSDAPMKVDIIPKECQIIGKRFNKYQARFNTINAHNDHKTVLYGAPDLETRAELSRSGLRFIAGTHKDDEYQLIENPEIDTDIQIETYGKVNVSVFFLNQIMMTIDFLKYLANTDLEEEQRQNYVIAKQAMFDERDQIRFQTKEFRSGSKRYYVEKMVPNITTETILPDEEEF